MRASRPRWYLRLLRLPDGTHDAKALETERLLLRPVRMRDARQFNHWARDAEVSRYVLWDAHISLSQTRSAIRGMILRAKLDGLAVFALVTREDGRMVGTIGLVWRDMESSSAEVGFSLARDHWGQGLMTEALTGYLHFAFTRLRINRVEAQHDVRNPASGRVMQKAGMRLEGCLRARLFYKGEHADVALYSALRDEWLAGHEGITSGIQA